MRTVLPSILALAIAAGEPLTATPWDVRKDADELAEDIERKRADPHELIERARRLLDAHGDALVTTTVGAAPLTDVLWAKLSAAGLAEAFSQASAAAAERSLQDLTTLDVASLSALARRVPGTPAARSAWRRAADIAWDHGQLAQYHDCAVGAGDASDPARKQRLEVALRLGGMPSAILPAAFEGIGQMWRLPLEFTRPDEADGDNPGRHRRPQQQRPTLSEPADTSLAVCDGQQLAVVDHLTGSILGRRTAIGARPIPTRSARPVRIPGGFAAAGIDTDSRLVLVGIDAAGSETWRQTASGEDIAAISAPVLVDGIIAVAYIRMADDRCQLRLAGFSASDGAPRWDTAVAILMAQSLFSGSGEWLSPSICRHARGFAVLSNAGLWALVGSDGAPRRLWTYPTLKNNQQLGPSGARQLQRTGAIVSDGLTAVASPADQPGLTLVLDPAGEEPRAYRGDGADGEVLAVQGDVALLAGRQATLVDLPALKPRWSVSARVVAAVGDLGPDAALVAGSDQVLLLSRQDGHMLGGRAMPRPASVASAQGVLVVADGVEIRGFGDAASFLQRLSAAVAAAPEDPRPLAALAGVLAGRGEAERAIETYLKALRLGADAGVAERAARLLRTRLDDADPAIAAGAITSLTALAERLPPLRDEIPFWKGRLAEVRGDQANALANYRLVLAGPDRGLPLAEGLTSGLRFLATAGIARLDAQAPRPLPAPEPAAEIPKPTTAWHLETHRSGALLTSRGLAISFADGLLTAWKIADGSEAWFRAPLRPVLGVQPDAANRAEGVPINIVPGTAAQAAGLRNGDVLRSLNGKPLRDFEADLRPSVLALGVGATVTFEVIGPDGPRTVRGRIGGEPVEPMAASAKVVLARATMPTSPDRSDLRFFALDLATGKQLWIHTLPADRNRMESFRPMLAPGDTVVAADGSDLVGLDALDGSRRWALPGRADLLSGARALGGCLWLRERSGGAGHLIDPRSGSVLAVVPNADPDAALPVLDGTELVVRETDGRLAGWDLGRGRLRFRTANDWTNVCAMRSETILAVDGQGRLAVIDRAAGTVRRQILDNAQTRTFCVGPERMLVLAETDGRQALAGVALDGGVALWQLRLPIQVEVVSMVPAGRGFLVRLRDAAGASSALLMDQDGAPLCASSLGADAADITCLPSVGGLLASHATGIRVIPTGLPPTAAPIPSLDLGTGDIRATMTARAGELAWQPHPSGTYAVARSGNALILAVLGNADTAIRIADAIEPLAADAVLALASAEGSTRTAVGGQWAVAETWPMPDPRGGGTLACSIWRPTPGRPAGTPVRLHIGSDAPDQPPWWLAQAWRQVAMTP